MGDPLRILRLAAGGDGVGQLPDGRVVFVPRTAQGDLIEIAGLREHRRFARARVARVVEASPARVEPRCPHYVADDCGGCQLQHLGAEAQRDARRGFVGDALRRIAKRDVVDPELVPAERAFDYRTKLTLAVSEDGRRIGMHPYGRATEVFQLDWCHIARPELMELWRVLRGVRALFPPRLAQVVLRLDRMGGRHVVFRVGAGEAWTGAPRLRDAILRHGQDVVLWWHPEAGAPRAMAGASEAFPITAFEQVHPEMGDRVREFAVVSLGEVAGQRVWDLYAGIGETSARLAAAGAAVESVESDAQAVATAAVRAPAVRRHLGRAESVLGELRPPEAVVTNPPRTGMDERVTAAIERHAPRRVAYISCDPATLARDLGRLPSYRLAVVRAFDLFPQTAHVETVAMLERI